LPFTTVQTPSMKLKQLSLKQSLNDSYRLIKPERADIEKFKYNFKLLQSHINPKESEENMKGHVMDFLKNTYYTPNYHIATKGRTDFVIHTGKDATHPAAVLFEVKKPSSVEMITLTNLNTKAMHEIMLYYLRERIEQRNNDIRYLVVTNSYEWFVFDALVFERLFFRNHALVKEYKAWMAKQKVSSNNDLFYNEIAKSFLSSLTEEIEFTWFDIREFEPTLLASDKKNDNKLIPLFKVLSPMHLLKLPFANDSNSLNKGFYSELLYLIGLEEVKEGSKKIIRRKQQGKRNYGSLLENTIIILETENCLHKVSDRQSYGDTKDEQIFSVALELCITWINRILFLKLLEAQLLKYHKGNNNYRFLNYKVVPQYDELYKLFFQVLAKKQEERIVKVKDKYSHIPYLNSSLFDITALEDQTLRINMLDDTAEINLPGNTVLKNDHNKPIAEKLNTLQYIFEFLNAYDFASEGSEEIQEEIKTLINASVLGLIFEKIDGYKDGSIFTPGFITMYMCRQSIRQAVLNKFKENYKWKAETFEDLYNYIADDRSVKSIQQHNSLINSLTICDPAVGSGHFLVSALNELIAIKSELGILADENGKRLSNYTAKVENDELLIIDRERNFFTYSITTKNGKLSILNEEMQRVQTTLFHEKQTIIENCLFGVDINPKSVQICRLRLWIELLKNAYYIADGNTSNGELQTLPNIDINIKTGNSLISRFALDEDLKAVFRQGKYKVETYKIVVQTYKDSKSKEEKAELQAFVNDLKEQFKTVVYRKDPLRNKIQQLRGDLLLLTTANVNLFGKKKTDSEVKAEVKELELNIQQKEKALEEKENSKIYNNAFEWRFEFPEVLDNEGNFIGFDVVIGNPPYYSLSKIKEQANYFARYKTYSKGADIYCLFYERGNQILKQNGFLTYITSNSWLKAIYGELLIKYFTENMQPISLLNIEDIQIFDEATVESNILNLQRKKGSGSFRVASLSDSYFIGSSLTDYFSKNSFKFKMLETTSWVIGNEEAGNLKAKIEKDSKQLKDFKINISFGIKTGYNKAFIIDEELKNKLIKEDANCYQKIKPILRGRDLKKFSYEPPNLWLICTFPSLKINIEEYPSLKNHFLKIGQTRLEQSGRLGSRKKTANKWFETQDSISFWKDFERPKIIWGEISDVPKFAYDDEHYYAEATTFLLTGENLKYLLAILNSKVSQWYFDQIGTTTGMGTNRWKKYKIELLPIKDIDENEQHSFIDLVDKIISAKKENPKADTSQLENEIDKLVYKLYNLTPEEIKIIEESVK
jgi:adenine-specific DNA-methyltransferase